VNGRREEGAGDEVRLVGGLSEVLRGVFEGLRWFLRLER
jgi:hypothetical protein